jgi:hypothetical protein
MDDRDGLCWLKACDLLAGYRGEKVLNADDFVYRALSEKARLVLIEEIGLGAEEYPIIYEITDRLL